MPILTREQILAASDVPEEIIEVPEWGGEVRVRGMTVGARSVLLAKIADASGKIDVEKATLYAFIEGVVEPRFSEEDYAALRDKSAAVLDRITRRFLALAGLDTAALSEARKNS